MATSAKFRIDVAINDLLINSLERPKPAGATNLTLPNPVFPQYPERLNQLGPISAPQKRKWGTKDIYRTARGWLFPYVRSRVMPGDFHPLRPTFLWSTNAISIVGIAGLTAIR